MQLLACMLTRVRISFIFFSPTPHRYLPYCVWLRANCACVNERTDGIWAGWEQGCLFFLSLSVPRKCNMTWR